MIILINHIEMLSVIKINFAIKINRLYLKKTIIIVFI